MGMNKIYNLWGLKVWEIHTQYTITFIKTFNQFPTILMKSNHAELALGVRIYRERFKFTDNTAGWSIGGT